MKDSSNWSCLSGGRLLHNATDREGRQPILVREGDGLTVADGFLKGGKDTG